MSKPKEPPPTLAQLEGLVSDEVRVQGVWLAYCQRRVNGLRGRQTFSFADAVAGFRRELAEVTWEAGGDAAAFRALEVRLAETWLRLEARQQRWATVRCCDCGAAWSEHSEWVKRCPACRGFELLPYEEASA